MSVLSLPEELSLLAYDNDKGQPRVERNRLDHGVAGAVLSELVLTHRVEVDAQRLTVVSAEPTGRSLADAALQRVAADPDAHRPSEWVSLLRIGLRDQVLAALVQQGVLRRREQRLLGLLARQPTYPAVNPRPELDLRRQLAAVVDEGEPAQSRTAALTALIVACDMDSRLSSALDGDQLTARLEEVAGGDPVGPVVRTAINTVDDGLMASAGRVPRRHRSRF